MSIEIGFNVYSRKGVAIQLDGRRYESIDFSQAAKHEKEEDFLNGNNEFGGAWANFFKLPSRFAEGEEASVSPTFYKERDGCRDLTYSDQAPDYKLEYKYRPFNQFVTALEEAIADYRKTYIDRALEQIAADKNQIAHLERLQQGATVTAIAFDKWQEQIEDLRNEITGYEADLEESQAAVKAWQSFVAKRKRVYRCHRYYVVPYYSC